MLRNNVQTLQNRLPFEPQYRHDRELIASSLPKKNIVFVITQCVAVKVAWVVQMQAVACRSSPPA